MAVGEPGGTSALQDGGGKYLFPGSLGCHMYPSSLDATWLLLSLACALCSSPWHLGIPPHPSNNPCSSVAALTECMQNKQQVRFFRECQEQMQHALPLGAYLLKPVQRILKYHLLLQVSQAAVPPPPPGPAKPLPTPTSLPSVNSFLVLVPHPPPPPCPLPPPQLLPTPTWYLPCAAASWPLPSHV